MPAPVPFTGPVSTDSTPANIGIRLAGFAGLFPSVGGVDTDIFTFTIPANTLVNQGDSLHVRAGGRSVTTVESKTANLIIGSTGIFSVAMNTLSNGYFFEAWITKEAASNAAMNYGRAQRALGFVQSIDNNSIAIDWTVANNFIFRITSATSGTIEMRWCHVDLFRVPV